MRVAVIFFGIARGASRSMDSIKRNIYACNIEQGVSFYTIASLNLVERVNNPRTAEIDVLINPDQALLLNADSYLLIRQDDSAISVSLDAAKQRRDVFDNGWISVRNALHQLLSLRRAWTMCAQLLNGQFDFFLFVRPDLVYLDEIRIMDVASRFEGKGNIAVPPWNCYGGFNDRFAFADATAARHYAERLELVPQYCANLDFHSESFLTYALEMGNCKVCALPVRAQRVRANDLITREDFNAAVIGLPVQPRPFSVESRTISFNAEEKAALNQ